MGWNTPVFFKGVLGTRFGSLESENYHCAARQPAEYSCFSFENTALQPAWPTV